MIIFFIFYHLSLIRFDIVNKTDDFLTANNARLLMKKAIVVPEIKWIAANR